MVYKMLVQFEQNSQVNGSNESCNCVGNRFYPYAAIQSYLEVEHIFARFYKAGI